MNSIEQGCIAIVIEGHSDNIGKMIVVKKFIGSEYENQYGELSVKAFNNVWQIDKPIIHTWWKADYSGRHCTYEYYAPEHWLYRINMENEYKIMNRKKQHCIF